MASYVPEARLKLSYPLYGADFDPFNPDFLLVGGGGGSTSSGVPNKISLLDVSKLDQLVEIADIELAKDEDSVTTLAVASSNETSLTAIAGINSSTIDQAAGRNEHLRSFRIALPPRRRKADGNISEKPEKSPRRPGSQALGKTALFRSAHGKANDTYQRVLRASPVKTVGEARITAIASGLAPDNEVIAFQPVSNAHTSTVDEISRISLGKPEAADVDVISIKGNGHVLAYCTDNTVFVQQLPSVKGSTIESPLQVYKATDSKPKFRALRFLSPRHVLLLQNKPGRTGASLLILKINAEYTSGSITLQKQLHKSTKAAVGLDTAILSPSEAGDYQTIIAVASQDSSIDVLTIDYSIQSGFRSFRPYIHLQSAHAGPLTRLVFSNFIAPSPPNVKDTPLQFIRLASVSASQTVLVHTLPLRPFPSKSKSPQYALNSVGNADAVQNTFSILIALVVVVIVAVLMQTFCEIRGAVPTLFQRHIIPVAPDIILDCSTTNAEDLSASLSSAISAIIDAPSHIPTVLSDAAEQVPIPLQSLLASNNELETPRAIVIRAAGALSDSNSDSSSDSDSDSAGAAPEEGRISLSTALHHDVEHLKDETVKKWEDLSEHQQQGWKEKLTEAGHWVEGQGEGVLKGVFFGELAGAVAGLMG